VRLSTSRPLSHRPGPVRGVRREILRTRPSDQHAGATKPGYFLALTDADWEDGYALKFFGHLRLRARPGRS